MFHKPKSEQRHMTDIQVEYTTDNNNNKTGNTQTPGCKTMSVNQFHLLESEQKTEKKKEEARSSQNTFSKQTIPVGDCGRPFPPHHPSTEAAGLLQDGRSPEGQWNHITASTLLH